MGPERMLSDRGGIIIVLYLTRVNLICKGDFVGDEHGGDRTGIPAR